MIVNAAGTEQGSDNRFDPGIYRISREPPMCLAYCGVRPCQFKRSKFEPVDTSISSHLQPSKQKAQTLLYLNYVSAVDIWIPYILCLLRENPFVSSLQRGLLTTKIWRRWRDSRAVWYWQRTVWAPLSGIGNERFRCMAAIGYAYDKDIFCFPWLSRMRFDYYHRNLTDVLQILKDRQKIVIFPIGKTW